MKNNGISSFEIIGISTIILTFLDYYSPYQTTLTLEISAFFVLNFLLLEQKKVPKKIQGKTIAYALFKLISFITEKELKFFRIQLIN